MTRDIIAEAKAWRTQVLAKQNNSSDALREALAAEDLSEETLTRAYNHWWGAYTEGIRKAPKSRESGWGVRASDARAAGLAADEVVLSYLAETREEG